MKLKRKNLIKVFIIFLIIVSPFLNANYFDNINSTPVVQEDLSFYQVNTCKISLIEFFISQKEAIFQDHFYLRFNNSSSISCFGRISGVTFISDGFYISVGTNPLINLLLQGTLWTIIFSFIKKDEKKAETTKYIRFYSLLLTAYLFTFSIYAEQRFYSKNFYFFDLESNRSYLFLFLVIYFVLKNLTEVLESRFYKITNFIPLTYLLMGVFGGFNINIYSLIIIYFGISSLFLKKGIGKYQKIYLLFSSFWVFNTSKRYYFEPGKFRGFTNSIYEFNSVLLWTILFYIFLNGLFFIYNSSKDYFDFNLFSQNMQITSILLVCLGFLGANFPSINFLNYFIFGQQKIGINLRNPFIFNEFSEKVPWRGFYTSAESAGEFYGLTIFFILYIYYKNKKLKLFDFVSIIFAGFGLYFSNNRAVFALLAIFIIYFTISQYQFYSKFRIPIFVIFAIIPFLFNLNNFGYSYDYTGDLIYGNALTYRYDTITSSFLDYIISAYENNKPFKYILNFISTVAFLINRSVLWGIFSARYNPTSTELIFGTGPFTLGQTYGEILISDTDSFLLPHSSILSFIIYFGLLGVFLIFLLLYKAYKKNQHRINNFGNAVIIFIILNIFKNDVLNYISSLMLYSFLLFIILKLRNEEVFSD